MKRALITGIAGQDGSYLAPFLLAKGYHVSGTVRPGSVLPAWLAAGANTIALHVLDIRDRVETARLVADVPADEIYHLAAQSRVGASWEDPVETAAVSGLGALHILDAVRALPGVKPRLLMAGSCEVFGRTASAALSEDTLHAPISPYGAAKSFAQRMTALYRERFDMFATTAILFNHESPRRDGQFVSRKIVDTAVLIARGEARELRLGNVDVVRDWGFAGDHVEAMWRMLQQPAAEDLVIGTGVGHSVREFAEEAFRMLGLDLAAHLAIDPSLVRLDDARMLVANPVRARERLDWTPTVDFAHLVRMLVDAARDPNPH
ncbi:MAG: GDP-mannose 4,6-dehydratase [Gemmatimonadaceae bacterium]|nr:GDP-mannose 4,6-dehydratase [Gemmatimonadaceae bacterium]